MPQDGFAGTWGCLLKKLGFRRDAVVRKIEQDAVHGPHVSPFALTLPCSFPSTVMSAVTSGNDLSSQKKIHGVRLKMMIVRHDCEPMGTGLGHKHAIEWIFMMTWQATGSETFCHGDGKRDEVIGPHLSLQIIRC